MITQPDVRWQIDEQKYFVYKISITGTRFFYFGITTDPHRRCVRHAGIIHSNIKYLSFDRKGGGNTGHWLVAKALIKGKRFLEFEHGFDKSRCVIEILNVTDKVKEAVKLETGYIQKYKDNPDCFNTEKYSKYYHRPSKKTIL